MFSKNIHKRIKIVLLIVIIVFIIIIAKVFYIEVIDYKKLNKLANGLWSRNLPIEADRGKIYTIDGELLAGNVTTTSLVFIPNQIKDKNLVAEQISKVLGVSKENIEKHIYKKTMMERVHPEGRRLSYEIADQINSFHFDGVYLLKESKREYTHNEMLSHVLGYVGIDNQGLSGLELQYDDILTGEYGGVQYFSDAKGNNLDRNSVYVEPEDGLDIYLTVNYELQSSIERELDNIVTKYNPEGAWTLAMDPNTGEILGMSSRPNFNPNNYKNYSTEVINRNMAIWASYEPGSTFKILTVSAAVNEGKVDLLKDSKLEIKNYGENMLKKLGIICTTLNNNKIILIEDVFKSLTQSDIDAVRIFLLNLKSNGYLIIITGRQKEEFTYFADKIYELESGTLNEIL